MPALLHVSRVASPIGPLFLLASDGALAAVSFDAAGRDRVLLALTRAWPDARVAAAPRGHEAGARLEAYFDGAMSAFDGIALRPEGSPFQREVWGALMAVPAGTTVSYGTLARRIGRPAAVRAVGAANGANPVAIVVPCHRVIASDGTLHGYGGGLDRKRWLLDHEARHAGRQRPLALPR